MNFAIYFSAWRCTYCTIFTLRCRVAWAPLDYSAASTLHGNYTNNLRWFKVLLTKTTVEMSFLHAIKKCQMLTMKSFSWSQGTVVLRVSIRFVMLTRRRSRFEPPSRHLSFFLLLEWPKEKLQRKVASRIVWKRERVDVKKAGAAKEKRRERRDPNSNVGRAAGYEKGWAKMMVGFESD